MSVHFLNETTGWVTGTVLIAGTGSSAGWIYITRDGGQTWQLQNLDLPAGVKSISGLELSKPHCFSQQEGALPASVNMAHDGTPNGFFVYTTQNGGQSWQSKPFVEMDNNKIVNENEGIHTLVYHRTPAPQFIAKDFGWNGGGNQSWLLTTDGGRSWQRSEFPLPLSSQAGLQFVSRNVGWMNKVGNGQSSQFSMTNDGAKTWTQIDYVITELSIPFIHRAGQQHS